MMTVMTGKPPERFTLGSGAPGVTAPITGFRSWGCCGFLAGRRAWAWATAGWGCARSLSLRVKEEHGAEAPQLAFRIGGVLGFKGFLRLGELSPVFRGRGQFPGSQVTGDEALGAEFTYQDGLAFRGDGLVQVIIRTAFYKRRDSIAAYVEMGRKGRGLRNCHDESKDQRLIYLRRSGAFCQFRSVEAVPWRPHSAGTRLEEGENLVSRKPEEGLFLPASREPPGRASGW